MLFHKFDAQTKIFIESIESEEQPESSTSKPLPEITTHYTVAFVDDEWVSVLRPEFEVINDKIQLKVIF